MRNMYTGELYLEKKPTWHVEDSPWKAAQILKMIYRNNINPVIIGEIGCGAGAILQELQARLDEKCVFYGYEISPRALDLCRPRANERLHFKLIDITREDDQLLFDLVLAIDVIEHIEDYFDFLHRIRKKGEYKIFHIPLEINVVRVIQGYPILHSWKNSGHIHVFTKETALQSLLETGYEIIDYFYTCNFKWPPIRYWKSCILKLLQKSTFALHRDMAVRLFGGCSLMVLAK